MTTALPPALLSPSIQSLFHNGISLLCECYQWSTQQEQGLTQLPGINARKDTIHLILPSLRHSLSPAALQRVGGSPNCLIAVTLEKAVALVSSVMAKSSATILGKEIEGEMLSLLEEMLLACDAAKLQLRAGYTS